MVRHPTARLPLAICLVVALPLAACSDDEASETGDTGDIGGDGVADLGDTAAGGGPCLDEVTLDETFDIHASGPTGQIHPHAAFDGTGVWVTWSQPAAEGTNFEVWAARYGCDASTLVEPLRVHDPSGVNQLDSSVAVAGELAMIAWQSDEPALSPNNLDIRLTVLQLDGVVTVPAMTLEASRAGAPNEGNAWMVDITGLDDRGFALTGAWGVDEVGRFQTFVVGLDGAGRLFGDAVDAGIEAEVSQVNPHIVALGGDRLGVAYTHQPDDGAAEVYYREVDLVEPLQSGVVGPTVDGVAGAGATLAAGPDDQVFAAFSGAGGTIVLAEIGAVDGDPPRVTVGVGNGFRDEAPSLTHDGERGVMAWGRTLQGTQSRLVLVGFEATGGAVALGNEASPNGEALIGAYPPGLVAVGEGVVFVAWADGENPDFRVKGRFVELTGP